MTAGSAGRAAGHPGEDTVARCAALVKEGHFEEARALARRLAEAPPTGTFDASELGILLFELGEMAQAARILAAEKSAGTASPEALRVLSALLHKVGDLYAARQLLIEATHRAPFRGLRRDYGDKPVLLRITALHQSYFGITRDAETGLFRRGVRRGHFSTRHFIDGKRFHVIVAALATSDLPNIETLPKPDLVVNSAACADLNPAGLEDAARFAGLFPNVPLINAPDRVLATSRTGNASRLSDIEGVIFPQTVNIRRPPDPEIALHMLRRTSIGFPLILRHSGSQTGRTMELAHDEADVLRYVEDQPVHQPLVAIRFHDARDTNGRYRKLRVFFIDGVMYPVVDLRSDHWNLHSADRYRIMVDDPEMQKAELRFLEDPASVLGTGHMQRLAKISEIIGLEFLGIDFLPRPDGQLLVFEANPAMRHNYDHLEKFPYRRPFLDQISSAFGRMLEDRLTRSGSP